MGPFDAEYFASVAEAAILRAARHCDAVSEGMAPPMGALAVEDDMPGGNGRTVAAMSLTGPTSARFGLN